MPESDSRAEQGGGYVSQAIAIAAALGGSLVFGASSVAEQRGTKRVQTRKGLSFRLILDLVRQPVWLIGIGATLVGFALQVVALSFGPLALVEPILVSDLIIAVLISTALRKQWDSVLIAGVVGCAAGVAGFLVIARPSGGRSDVSFTAVIPLAVGLAVVLAGCLTFARRNKTSGALALALACGIDYGIAAFVVKLLTADFGHGLLHVFTHWPIYALAIVGPLGFLLNQEAFQQGILLSPVLAIITVCDPLVSIALAHFLLNESLTDTPAAIAGQFIALAIMTTGIVVIAREAPMVVENLAERTKRAEQAASSPRPQRSE
jgi:hypothetical protein